MVTALRIVTFLVLAVLCLVASFNAPAAADSRDEVRSVVIDAVGRSPTPSSLRLPAASSPDGLRLERAVGAFETGTILLYFVDFSTADGTPHSERLAFVASTDGGRTWSDRRPVSFDVAGIANRAVDPSIVQLIDGRIRIYVMTPGRDREGTIVRIATSRDGVHFAMEDAVFATIGYPEVVRIGSTWYMAVTDVTARHSILAVSDDGLSWRDSAPLPFTGAGILASTTHSDPRGDRGRRDITLFANAPGLEWLRVALPRGSILERRHGILPHGGIAGEPSPVALPDGRLLLFYKWRDGGRSGSARPGAADDRASPPRRNAPRQPGSPPDRYWPPPS